jgi:hypothetical protein
MKRADSKRDGPVRTGPDSTKRKRPSRPLRYCINLWVVLHFTAIIAAAGSIGPASGYVLTVWQIFRPYLEVLYLNHGFNFYAPEPSATMLITFEAEREDGTIATGQIPDPTLRPRLLLQRHLLLTEHIGLVPVENRGPWYRSYAHHLCRKFGARKVHLTLVRHEPMPMDLFRNGGHLDDPITYMKLDLGDFTCDEP